MKNDKKNEGAGINFTLLSKIGVANFNIEVDIELILESLNYYNNCVKTDLEKEGKVD